jgi:hypothetical protein
MRLSKILRAEMSPMIPIILVKILNELNHETVKDSTSGNVSHDSDHLGLNCCTLF